MGKKAGAGIAISAVLGVISGGLGAWIGGVAQGVQGATLAANVANAAMISGALGAAVGALGLLGPKGKNPKNQGTELEITSSIRDRRVPVVYGRARCEGNYEALGGFGGIDRDEDGVPGNKLRVIHALIALCEGAVRAMGNLHVNGLSVKLWAKQFGIEPSDDEAGVSGEFRKFFRYFRIYGTPTETVHAVVADPVSRFRMNPAIPHRNTAQVLLHMVVGDKPNMPGIQIDVVGPDLKIARTGSSGESPPSDSVGICGGYDGYTGCYWYTLFSSGGGTAAPYGVVRVGREASLPTRSHTPPPTAVTVSVVRGWYLGRHDIVLMQDPADWELFWLGRWGLDRDSAEWEGVRPAPDGSYSAAILAYHLDEDSGVLHTLHDDGLVRYIMRYNLLTGFVERADTALPGATYRALMYSPDFDGYWVASNTADLRLIDWDTGAQRIAATAVSTANCNGLCVAGLLVGVVSNSGLTYYDPYGGATVGPYGTGTSGVTKGEFGGTALAQQNTWTGHVALFGKSDSGSAAFVSFIASVPDLPEDTSALGTQGEAEFQTFLAVNNVTDAFRDWSWRKYAAYSLTSLEGNSGLAAAAWASCVDELNVDSARWGAGMAADYFKLSAFESVHAFSVGPMKFKTPKRLTESGAEVPAADRWAERAKFDYLLDGEQTAGNLVGTEILGCVNGYRAVREGQLYPSVLRRGSIPAWHFTDAQIITDDQGPNLVYVASGRGTNRVRVRFTNVRDDYRADFAQADDEYDQDRRHRLQEESLDFRGIARYEHAQWLAKQALDTYAAGRRRLEFRTHFRALILAAGDVVMVTSTTLALERVLFRIMEIRESSGGSDGKYVYTITAVEHPRHRDALRLAANGPPLPYPDDDTPPEPAGSSAPVSTGPAPQVQGKIRFFNKGAALAPGTYRVTYLKEAFRLSQGGNFRVSGSDVVSVNDSDVVIVMAAAPGSSTQFATLAQAEDASAGMSVDFVLAEAAPVGLRLQPGFTPYARQPYYKLERLF